MTSEVVVQPQAKKKKKMRRRWVLFGALAALLLMFVVSVEVTSSSKFCSACHYMKPFFQSWQESSHNDVECKTCHYPPGLRSTLRAKMEGLVMVGRYWTKLYLKSKPWAEIQDESCLQSGCHDRRLLEGQVKFGKVVFDHKVHFADLKRGKQLRCTSCHSQIVQGEHITVTENSCFICHFKPSESHPLIGNCASCHRQDDLLATKDRFDHSPVFRNGFSCDKCHSHVIMGDGAVPRDNCYKCHFERERLDQYDDTDLVHRMHISANKIECDQCHLQIQHKIVKDIETVADCKTCHTNLHQAQKILFLGAGGKGVTHAVPNVMFEKGLSCKGCHIFHEEVGGRLVTAETSTSAAQACASCHGRGFERILHNWETATEKRLSEVKAVYGRAAAEVERRPASKRAAARKLLDEAAFNIDVVERGKSVHNMTYSQELLGVSLGRIREALAAAGSEWEPELPEVLTRETPNACLNCHAGIEEMSPAAFGLTFPHRNHIIKQGMACAACHSNARRHGELTATKSSCAACHHEEPDKKDCGHCHSLQKTLYDGGPFEGLTVPKDIMAEAGADCAACHVDGAKKVVRPDAAACAACHDEAYRGTFEEWRTTVSRLLSEARAGLHELYKRPLIDAEKAQVRSIEKGLEALELDGSRGIHNFVFAEEFLTNAVKTIKSLGAGVVEKR